MVDWGKYLQSVRNEYGKRLLRYTPTDLSRELPDGKPREQDLFDLWVQKCAPAEERGKPSEFESELQPEKRIPDKEKTEKYTALEGLRKYAGEHVLLTGKPGSGKTTALLKLLYEEAGGALENKKSKIPVLVELKRYENSVIGIIKRFLQKHKVLIKVGDIERLLYDGHFLLLIDGLNELPSSTAWINLGEFRDIYIDSTAMVFTTREIGAGGDLGLKNKLEMLPLTEQQVKDFVNAYLPGKAGAFVSKLRDRLWELGRTPLFLWMLCGVYKRTGDIPENLGMVFRSFTGFYEEEKKDVPVDKESRRRWPEMLQYLAFNMMRGEKPVDLRLEIPFGEGVEIISDALKEKGVVDSESKANKYLEDLIKYHLVQTAGDGKFEFHHQLIQEYYAAEYLLHLLPNLEGNELQREYLNFLKWTEPVNLMLGLIEGKDQALNIVKSAVEIDFMLAARLAGSVKPVYQEASVDLINELDIQMRLKGFLLGKTKSGNAVTSLSDLLNDEEYYVRSNAAEALGDIGSDRAVGVLLEALADEVKDVRRSAGEALGKIGSDDAVDALIKTLGDECEDVKQSAAEALGNIGGDCAIDALIKTLGDKNWDVRRSAIDALGKIGSDGAVDALIEVFGDASTSWSVAQALGEIGGDRAVDALINTLGDKDKDVGVRRSAAEVLGDIGSDRAVDALIEVFGDEDIFWIVAQALGDIGGDRAVDALINTLGDKDKYEDIRWSAAQALGKIGSEQAVDSLIKTLGDEDEDIRRSAAEALGDISSDRAVDALIEALEDEVKHVKQSAAEALGNIGSDRAVDALIKALEDEDVGWYAAYALGNIGSDRAVDALIKALEDEVEHVKRSAAYALGDIGSDHAVGVLLEELAVEVKYVKRGAAETLGNIGSDRAVDALIKTLEDEFEDVRGSAAEALGNIGSDRAVDALIKTLGDKDKDVRGSAAEALGNIGSDHAVDALIEELGQWDGYISQGAAEALGNIGSDHVVDALIEALEEWDDYVRRKAAEVLGSIGSDRAVDALIEAVGDDDIFVRWSVVEALGDIGSDLAVDALIESLGDEDVRWSSAEALGKIGGITALAESLRLIHSYSGFIAELVATIASIQGKEKIYNPSFLPFSHHKINILHLSDLHFGTKDDAKNWFTQLRLDLENELKCTSLDCLVISGDIANKSTKQEYDAAMVFVQKLSEQFKLSPDRIVVVPGNHDVNWTLSKKAHKLKTKSGVEKRLKKRSALFSKFCEEIKGEAYPEDYEKQGICHHFHDYGLLILGLNSAWKIDHKNTSCAGLCQPALAEALNLVQDEYRDYIKIAVWHHPLISPGEDRIKVHGFMELLAQAGFSMALHGHIHKAESNLYRYDMSPKGRKIEIIGAGTFGAATHELVPAYPWQYNLIQIDGGKVTVHTRRREEENGAWKPDARWLQGPGEPPLPYYEFEITCR